MPPNAAPGSPPTVPPRPAPIAVPNSPSSVIFLSSISSKAPSAACAAVAPAPHASPPTAEFFMLSESVPSSVSSLVR